jgi:uncharacterized pyridoxal phosphate-containing UPF0001 family protein
MASFTDNQKKIGLEFKSLNNFYLKYKDSLKLDTLSMGMSGDYKIAIEHNTNMIRLGSSIFGSR